MIPSDPDAIPYVLCRRHDEAPMDDATLIRRLADALRWERSDRVATWLGTPREPWPVAQMVDEIRSATHWLLVGSYLLTDAKVAEAVIRSEALVRLVVVDAADGNRCSGALNRLRRCGIAVCLMGGPGDPAAAAEPPWPLMHAKFVLIDGTIGWLGSANATVQARTRNFESMSRFEERLAVCELAAQIADVIAPRLWRAGHHRAAVHAFYVHEVASDAQEEFSLDREDWVLRDAAARLAGRPYETERWERFPAMWEPGQPWWDYLDAADDWPEAFQRARLRCYESLALREMGLAPPFVGIDGDAAEQAS